jgi:hypothetical protein
MLYRLHIAMVGNQTQLWKALIMNVDVYPITLYNTIMIGYGGRASTQVSAQ